MEKVEGMRWGEVVWMIPKSEVEQLEAFWGVGCLQTTACPCVGPAGEKGCVTGRKVCVFGTFLAWLHCGGSRYALTMGRIWNRMSSMQSCRLMVLSMLFTRSATVRAKFCTSLGYACNAEPCTGGCAFWRTALVRKVSACCWMTFMKLLLSSLPTISLMKSVEGVGVVRELGLEVFTTDVCPDNGFRLGGDTTVFERS